MSTNFNSKKNKELLYNLLLNNNMFTGLPENLITNVQQEIENVVATIDKDTSIQPLIDKNKRFMLLIVRKISEMKLRSSNTNTTSIQDIPSSNNIEEIYTAEDIRQKNMNEFESSYTSAQDDFNNSMKLTKPEDVPFGDIQDDGPIENMDDILAKTIAERNLVIQDLQYDDTTAVPAASTTSTVSNEQTIKKEVTREISKGVTINENDNTVYEYSDNVNVFKMLVAMKDEQKQMKEQIDKLYHFITELHK
jgi:hypothetical protein